MDFFSLSLSLSLGSSSYYLNPSIVTAAFLVLASTLCFIFSLIIRVSFLFSNPESETELVSQWDSTISFTLIRISGYYFLCSLPPSLCLGNKKKTIQRELWIGWRSRYRTGTVYLDSIFPFDHERQEADSRQYASGRFFVVNWKLRYTCALTRRDLVFF